VGEFVSWNALTQVEDEDDDENEDDYEGPRID
jgi:hypothetical protein